MLSNIRNGNFTSSEIVALTKKDKSGKGFGAPALTYIEECNMERRLGRSLTDEISARATSWGKLVENRVHDILGIDYKLCSTETLSHPTVDFWKGSPDAIHFFEASHLDAACDFKCPLTLKSFCQLVDAFKKGGMDEVRSEHKDGEKFYWQLVSNACITDSKYGELIVYAPYRSELADIRTMSEGNPKYYWIWSASDDELPFLVEGGHYKNVNVMRFEIPSEDKCRLHDLVVLAGKELIEVPTLITA